MVNRTQRRKRRKQKQDQPFETKKSGGGRPFLLLPLGALLLVGAIARIS
jgi:hypothetical protein